MLGGLQTVTIFKQVENGRGKHAKELHVENFNEMLKYSWLNMLTYFVAIWTVKMSILAMYYRIGSGLRALPWILQARAVWITAALMTATAVASFLVSIFLPQLLACIPVTRTWNIQQQPEGCINGALFMQISAAINITTDVVMFLIPLPLLPLMKFNKKQRTALVLIFSIGLIPVIASTMRLCKIINAGSPVAEGKSWQDGDSSWKRAWVPIWSQIEVDVGIIVASLPSLNPPLKQVWTGTWPRRALTPSQLPDFPQYQRQRKSWEVPNENTSDREKSVKGGEVTFHDDGADTEDEVDVSNLLIHGSNT
ncbi:hypothetical protein BDU57DRAFT_570680 [Ampelomyces quisqualis]|uniref:Rhodopsin domain-containing protein n=1 Tax=Ampelomyces quisqualis TaxID=50730 RepID=A0A6A5QNP3_AMPQU|nr:hypothetical protein BDU57DRAFT_570680 [Ampelomyces quisqualis]